MTTVWYERSAFQFGQPNQIPNKTAAQVAGGRTMDTNVVFQVVLEVWLNVLWALIVVYWGMFIMLRRRDKARTKMLLALQEKGQPYSVLREGLLAAGIVRSHETDEGEIEVFFLKRNAQHYSIEPLALALGSWLHNQQFKDDQEREMELFDMAIEILGAYRKTEDQDHFLRFAASRHDKIGGDLIEVAKAIRRRNNARKKPCQKTIQRVRAIQRGLSFTRW